MSCLPDDLWARAKEMTAEGRHVDAHLMKSAAGYLEQYRDETVPALAKQNARLREAFAPVLACYDAALKTGNPVTIPGEQIDRMREVFSTPEG